MPVLNFQKRFVAGVLAGTKVHTIRFNVRPVRKGQLLYCQHGPRFGATRFAVLPAMRVRPVTLAQETVMVWDEDGRSFTVPPLDCFAQADGFRDWAELRDWFDDVYGADRPVLKGQLIQWAGAEWERRGR